jgi:hypothetical protein
MSDYGVELALCPFLLDRQNDKFRIKCEGPEKGTTTQITFRGDKRWYMKDYCCSNYQRCRVYQMLCSKYSK